MLQQNAPNCFDGQGMSLAGVTASYDSLGIHIIDMGTFVFATPSFPSFGSPFPWTAIMECPLK